MSWADPTWAPLVTRRKWFSACTMSFERLRSSLTQRRKGATSSKVTRRISAVLGVVYMTYCQLKIIHLHLYFKGSLDKERKENKQQADESAKQIKLLQGTFLYLWIGKRSRTVLVVIADLNVDLVLDRPAAAAPRWAGPSQRAGRHLSQFTRWPPRCTRWGEVTETCSGGGHCREGPWCHFSPIQPGDRLKGAGQVSSDGQQVRARGGQPAAGLGAAEQAVAENSRNTRYYIYLFL